MQVSGPETCAHGDGGSSMLLVTLSLMVVQLGTRYCGPESFHHISLLTANILPCRSSPNTGSPKAMMPVGQLPGTLLTTCRD